MAPHRPRVRRVDAPSAALVRSELERILSSEIFVRSDRLSAFLSFIVERTLNGDGESLKEPVIAAELYGKGADFTAAADPIVRVDARRLRDRLREYYGTQPDTPIVISVPKGSYTPVFETPLALPSVAPQAPLTGDRAERPMPRLFTQFTMAGLAIVTAIGVWLAIPASRQDAPAIRLLRATAFPGIEGGPATLSPDGNYLVVAWTAPDMKLGDLFVKAVDGTGMWRLTDTPLINEVMPVWSPDGLQIAFVRYSETDNLGVYVVSSRGGEERKIVDRGVRPTWMPDSKRLVFVDRIGDVVAPVLYSLKTGERRRLTTPPAGLVDTMPSVSPDGATLAFVRSTAGQIAPFGTSTRAALFVVPISGGEPRQLDGWAQRMNVPAWTPDGRDILYTRGSSSDSRLFRVAARGGRPAPVANLPAGADDVSASSMRPGRTFRVAIPDVRRDVGLRMIDLQSPQSQPQASGWTAFCDSTRFDWPGRFSRDGSRVSFTSDRDGSLQILVAGRDGSSVRTVTAFDGLSLGLASWSPGGDALVFDGVDRQGVHGLYRVGSDGGPIRRLAHGSERLANPEWSKDGQWIYFVSTATGRKEIWKMPVEGGSPIQLTTEGGDEPREDPDGTKVYFLALGPGPYLPTTLKQMSVAGGGISTVLSEVRPAAWDVTETGIVYLSGSPGIVRNAANPDAIELYRFSDRQSRRLAEVPFPVTGRGYSPPRVLIASPDGRLVVLSHMDNWERDVLVLDNFR